MRCTWRGLYLYQTCKLQFLSLHVHASHLYLYLEHVQARVRILSYRNVHIIVLNLHVALPMKEGSRQRIQRLHRVDLPGVSPSALERLQFEVEYSNIYASVSYSLFGGLLPRR